VTKLEIFADALVGPQCRDCGTLTRVIGMEQHAVIPQLTIVTLECAECGWAAATIAMPAKSTPTQNA
jgi:uncharacterized Zn finger protein